MMPWGWHRDKQPNARSALMRSSSTHARFVMAISSAMWSWCRFHSPTSPPPAAARRRRLQQRLSARAAQCNPHDHHQPGARWQRLRRSLRAGLTGRTPHQALRHQARHHHLRAGPHPAHARAALAARSEQSAREPLGALRIIDVRSTDTAAVHSGYRSNAAQSPERRLSRISLASSRAFSELL